jgi:formylmethanofuran dehydrogenase subunit D
MSLTWANLIIVTALCIRRTIMQFVELKSRGGDYYVVAANIAYLRVDENGQTKVGLIGGDSLLVVGSPAEIVAKVLAGGSEAKGTAES